MERFLVAFTAVALLLSGAEPSRADYVPAYRVGVPSIGNGQFLNSPCVAADLLEEAVRADRPSIPVQVSIVTSLRSFKSGDRPFFEPSGSATASFRNADLGDWFDARPRKFEDDAACLVDSGCLGIGGAHPYDLFGVELAKEIFVADTFVQRTEILSGEDAFLAKFGLGTAHLEPTRIAIGLAGDSSLVALLLQHRLLIGLSLLGIVVLAAFTFVLRQRRVVSHRGLRGPRGTAIYRSSTTTNPRGTIR